MSFTPSFGQFLDRYEKGQKYINRAKKLFESEKNLDKALILLQKADTCPAGFCGLGYSLTKAKIQWFRSNIYFAQKKYTLCLSTLDTPSFYGFNWYNTDSLKVETLIQLHGRQKVLSDFQRHRDSSATVYDGDVSICSIRLDSCRHTFLLTPVLPMEPGITNNDLIQNIGHPLFAIKED